MCCQSYLCLCVARQVIFSANWFKKVGKRKVEVALWGKMDISTATFFLFLQKSLVVPNKSRTFLPTVPATPPNNAYHGGTSSFKRVWDITSDQQTSPAQLVTLLQSRGLHIENVARTENYLRHIGWTVVAIDTIIQGGRGWETAHPRPIW